MFSNLHNSFKKHLLKSLITSLSVVAMPFSALADATSTASPMPPPVAHEPDTPTIQALPLEELRVFTRVYSNVRASYIKDIDDATLLEYAIKGILSELDPHSAYLDANKFDDLQVQTSGEFGGLGIEVGMEDGFVKVISPIDDTPAQRAGIEAGDLIIKLDAVSYTHLTLPTTSRV